MSKKKLLRVMKTKRVIALGKKLKDEKGNVIKTVYDIYTL